MDSIPNEPTTAAAEKLCDLKIDNDKPKSQSKGGKKEKDTFLLKTAKVKMGLSTFITFLVSFNCLI